MKVGDVVEIVYPSYHLQNNGMYRGIAKEAWKKHSGKKLVVDVITLSGPRLRSPTNGTKISGTDGYQWWWPTDFIKKHQPKKIKKVLNWK